MSDLCTLPPLSTLRCTPTFKFQDSAEFWETVDPPTGIQGAIGQLTRRNRGGSNAPLLHSSKRIGEIVVRHSTVDVSASATEALQNV